MDVDNTLHYRKITNVVFVVHTSRIGVKIIDCMRVIIICVIVNVMR